MNQCCAASKEYKSTSRLSPSGGIAGAYPHGSATMRESIWKLSTPGARILYTDWPLFISPSG
jgi:hypothetical protein